MNRQARLMALHLGWLFKLTARVVQFLAIWCLLSFFILKGLEKPTADILHLIYICLLLYGLGVLFILISKRFEKWKLKNTC